MHMHTDTLNEQLRKLCYYTPVLFFAAGALPLVDDVVPLQLVLHSLNATACTNGVWSMSNSLLSFTLLLDSPSVAIATSTAAATAAFSRGGPWLLASLGERLRGLPALPPV
jgi:hypothetical protein